MTAKSRDRAVITARTRIVRSGKRMGPVGIQRGRRRDMSVIVKGMEMPSGRQSCDFSDDETRFCKAAKEYIPMLGKPEFCPLVELPEKHGRLIKGEN